MKYLFLFITLLLVQCVRAQTEPANYKVVTRDLRQAYNEGSYTKFRMLLSDLVEDDIPIPELAAIFDALKPAYGSIRSFQFKKMDMDGANYKVLFDRGELDITLQLDSSGLITGLMFDNYPDLLKYTDTAKKKK